MLIVVPGVLHSLSSVKRSGPAALATIALALVVGANAAVFPTADARPDLAARWEGAVQIPGTDLRVVIDLAQDSKGNWAGSAIVPGFGIKGAPLADIAVKGSAVAFTIKGGLGDPKFEGRLDSDGALKGDYQQGGNTAPFLLRKAGPPQVENQRQSTSVGKELEGEWQGDFEVIGKKLRALVTLTNKPEGFATANFQTKGEIETKLPVDLVTQDGELLTLESPSSGFIYQGQFRQDTNEIKGDFQLGPYESPLVLHPALNSAAKP